MQSRAFTLNSLGVWTLLLLALAFIYSATVYSAPTLSGQSISGSYDAFSYAQNLSEDAVFARELQPFLHAYPAVTYKAALPLYAVLLHFILLAPPLAVIAIKAPRDTYLSLISALAIPESLIFLGAVSKEGLGIVAAIGALAGFELYFKKKYCISLVMLLYSIAVAEFSRPYFGAPFGTAIFIGLLPATSPHFRIRFATTAAILTTIGAWLILYGPLKDDFTQQYLVAKNFLIWFEENMGSDSSVKSLVRWFFSLAFADDEPTLSLLLIITLAAVGKAIVYLAAIPAISPPTFSEMPAQVWASTWQVASSMSSLAMLSGLWRLRAISISSEDRCRLYFGFTLLLLISISTAIFHVRYRAPAVVVVLAAIWRCHPRGRAQLPILTIPSLCATVLAIAWTT